MPVDFCMAASALLHQQFNEILVLSINNGSSPAGGNNDGSDEYFYSANHAEQAFRKMENYLQQKQLCDVLLIAGDHKIPAHRLVLCAVSDYFAAMFTSDVREAKQEEIKMEGVDPDALRDLVHYAYTGVLELKEETIESLLAAACLLQLSQVIEVCCNFLMKQLHPSNCLGIRSFGDAQGCTELLRVAHVYTMEHFTEVIKNQEFLLLPAAEIAKLLSSDDINVPDEEAIFKALMLWVRHDLQDRQRDLGMLLSYIRLPLLSPQLLADLENSPMFTDDLECQKLLMEAMKYHLLPERRSMMQSPRTKPRKSTVGSLYAVGGMDATKGTTTIEKYDLRTNSWIQIGTMNGRRLQFGVAVIDNKLYIVGGRDGLKTANTVECFNPVTKVWTVMPPMSTHRHGLGIANCGQVHTQERKDQNSSGMGNSNDHSWWGFLLKIIPEVARKSDDKNENFSQSGLSEQAPRDQTSQEICSRVCAQSFPAPSFPLQCLGFAGDGCTSWLHYHITVVMIMQTPYSLLLCNPEFSKETMVLKAAMESLGE
ncbi:Kelch-like protein 4 [Varanus komodoensis]|nr:Kelch-like protein 4 [Varanus komodoensis]